MANHSGSLVWLLSVMMGLLAVPVSQGQTTSITSSGLNTKVTLGSVDPAGRQNYDITGGTRPGNGGNLFHSFGDFSVGTNNVARFGNDSGLATTNILSRVTGGNPSNIFGEINTANFPGANLYLINPAGVVFGSTATLNVGGSVKVSTADYLRLADGLRFNAVPGPQDALLSSSPVAAFGFLRSDPAGVTVHSARLRVPTGQTLALVGGDIQVSAGQHDFPTLSAPDGQIRLASLAGRGEVILGSGAAGILVSSSTPLGTVTITNSGIDASGGLSGSGSIGGSPINPAGPNVVIRGGKLLVSDSSIQALGIADETGTRARETGISLTAADSLTITNSPLRTDGGVGIGGGPVSLAAKTVSLEGSGIETGLGDITVRANETATLSKSQLQTVNFGFAPNSGNIAFEVGNLHLFQSSKLITRGDNLGGRAGDITIQARGEVVLDGSQDASLPVSLISFNSGRFSEPGVGGGGTITITTPGLIQLNNSDILTQGPPSGSISLAGGDIQMMDSLLRAPSGQIQLSALAAPGVLTANVPATQPGLPVTPSAAGGSIMLTQGASIDSSAFPDSFSSIPIPVTAGPVSIRASRFVMDQAAITATNRGLSPDAVTSQVGGRIDVDAQTMVMNQSRLTTNNSTPCPSCLLVTSTSGGIDLKVGSLVADGSAITTLNMSEGVGRPGAVTIRARGGPGLEPGTVVLRDSTVLSQRGGTISIDASNGLVLSGPQSGLFTNSGIEGAGSIALKARDILVEDGAQIDSHADTCCGGTIDINVLDSFRSSGGTLSTRAFEGAAGSIRIRAGGEVTVENSALLTGGFLDSGDISIAAGSALSLLDGSVLSAASTQLRNGGNIVLDAGRQFLSDASRITAESDKAQAGQIRISANEVVQLLNGSQATVDNNGVGPAGSLTIDSRGTFWSQDSLVSASARQGTGGRISIRAPDQLRFTNSELLAGGARGGSFEASAGQFVADGTRVIANGVEGGGKIAIEATDSVVLRNSPIALDVSGSNPIPIPAPGGEVTIQANRVVMNDAGINARGTAADGGTVVINANETVRLDGSRIETGSGPAGGNISIHAGDSVRLLNGTVLATDAGGNAGNIVIDGGGNVVVDESRLSAEARRGAAGQIEVSAGDAVRFLNGTVVSANNLRQGPAGQIVVDAGGNALVDSSLVTAEPIEGQPGQIHINAGDAVRVVNGSRITVNNNGVGNAGILTVEAGTSVVGENSTFVAQTGEGHGGTIQITAPDRVRLTNSIVSTGVGGSPASVGGTIEITSETVRVENGRVVSNASNGSGGTVTIKSNAFRPDAASVVEAESLGGGGVDGTVSIQPLP